MWILAGITTKYARPQANTYVQSCLCNNHRRERGKKKRENKFSPNSPSSFSLSRFYSKTLQIWGFLCPFSPDHSCSFKPSADLHFIVVWALPLCSTMKWTLPLSSASSHNTLWPPCLLTSCHWDPSCFSTSPVIMLLWSTQVLLKGIDAWENSLALIVGLGGIRIGYLSNLVNDKNMNTQLPQTLLQEVLLSRDFSCKTKRIWWIQRLNKKEEGKRGALAGVEWGLWPIFKCDLFWVTTDRPVLEAGKKPQNMQ